MSIVAQDPFAGRTGNPYQLYDNSAVVTPSDTDELQVVASALHVQDMRANYAWMVATTQPSGDPVPSMDELTLRRQVACLLRSVAKYQPEAVPFLKTDALADDAARMAQSSALSIGDMRSLSVERSYYLRDTASIIKAAVAVADQFASIDADALVASTITALSAGTALPTDLATVHAAVVAAVPLGELSPTMGPDITSTEVKLLVAKALCLTQLRLFDNYTVTVSPAGGGAPIPLGGSGSGMISGPMRVRKVWATGTDRHVRVSVYW